MLRAIALLILALVFLRPSPSASAEDALLDFPLIETCPVPDPAFDTEYQPVWTQCERWVWTCIRGGLEANLHLKLCVKGRRDGDEPRYRAPYTLAAFYDPDRFAQANALSDNLIRTILSDPSYEDKVPPSGIRIFGAYFATSVNLENITTTRNLVLDGSIFKRGVRMTNFKTTKNVSFDGSNVRGSMLLMRAQIDGSLFLERGVFDFIDARDIHIGASLEASRSVFNDMLRFDRGRIDGKVYLVKSRLTSLNAWDSKIGGSMELRLADVRMRVDLSGSTIDGDLRLQQVSFGRQSGASPSCEWDADVEIDHVLREAYGFAAKKDPASGERVLNEMMRTRPTEAGKPAPSLCDAPSGTEKRISRHEMLLRSMKVDGTLCLMDTTGLIAAAPGSATLASARSLDTISLDGTRATSTVLRWAESDSRTLWRAVNFKTGHMLINLQSAPNRHFIDDMDIEFLSIVKRDRLAKEDILNEDDDKYLCDVTPRQDNVDAAEKRDTQDRIIDFFTTARNESGSSQPFAKVVARIESTGVNTIYMKKALSEYKLRTLCRNSLIVNTWNDKRQAAPDQSNWDLAVDTLTATFAHQSPTPMTPLQVVDETRKLALDGICAASLPIARYSVSYGHEPHNLFLWALFFILTFWFLLKLDKKPPAAVPAPHLGLIYAIDTFIPMSQLRMNRRFANVLPERMLLRWYLSLHRLIGLVICLAIFILVVNAAR